MFKYIFSIMLSNYINNLVIILSQTVDFNPALVQRKLLLFSYLLFYYWFLNNFDE